MAWDASIEDLFKERSFEEIESVRDNLATEIEKRTELLKSIVKDKYRDIVETSDAIQSMKLNLKEVEQSLWSLDKNISEYYARLKEPSIESSRVYLIQAVNEGHVEQTGDSNNIESTSGDDIVTKLFNYSAEIWDNFDSGNLKMSVKLLNDSMHLLEISRKDLPPDKQTVVNNLEITMNRAKEMIKNNLWHRIQVAAPDQIGIIAGSDQEDLYKLSLNSSMEFLVDTLRKDLSDTSFHAQIRRYQPYSYFNSQTNQIEPDLNDFKAPSVGHVQIPKLISPELNAFLYRVCRVVNSIAGFSLNRSSIVDSLRITIEHILAVYSDIIPLVDLLKAETKRKRALQLHFDLLYIRILLNTSKNTDLIERLDPKITELASRFEFMLDSIELYMISAALHSNVMSLSQTTIRLYGLLIPHLQ